MQHPSGRLTAWSVAGALALAACADGTTPAPSMTGPPTQVVTATACSNADYNNLIKAAKAYSTNTDPIVDLIRTMSGATDKVNTGFDVLRRLAEIRNTGIAKLATDGAKVARGTLVCAGHSTVPTQSEFVSVLTTGANGGLFEVRGGAGDPLSSAISLGATPRWGAEPVGGQTWASSLGQRALLYAYRIQLSTFSNEQPAKLDPNSTDELGTAFDINTVPAITPLPNPLLVGVCVADPTSYRLQNVSTIVALAQVSFCDPNAPPDNFRVADNSLLGLGSRMLAFLAPRALYAGSPGGTAGAIENFSPKGAVSVSASQIKLLIAPIADQNKDVPFTVTVQALTEKLTPIDGVVVRLAIDGNFGVGSDGVYEPILNPGVATTGGGYATFTNVVINKNGAYTLRAEGYFNGVNSLPTLFGYSNQFNVRP